MTNRIIIPSDNDGGMTRLELIRNEDGDVFIHINHMGRLSETVRLCTMRGGGRNPDITKLFSKLLTELDNMEVIGI